MRPRPTPCSHKPQGEFEAMALFRNQLDGSIVVLRPLHTFGRHPSVCQTVMKAPDVSQVHALFRWNLKRGAINARPDVT